MAEVRLRLNLDAEEVELVVDGKVATSTGPEVFKNWVDAYNEKHKPLEPEVVHEEHDKKVDVDEPVEEKHVPVEEETVETSTEEVVDSSEKE